MSCVMSATMIFSSPNIMNVSAKAGQRVALQVFVVMFCEELPVVLKVNLPDLLLQREKRWMGLSECKQEKQMIAKEGRI